MGSVRTRKGRILRMDDYKQQSCLPLQSLIFLLPMLIAYEFGALYYVDEFRGIYARRIIKDSFQWLGVAGYFIPVIVLVGVLISIHIANRNKFSFRPGIYLGMGIESIALAVLLLLAAIIWVGKPTPVNGPWHVEMLMSLGAGVYEELVFRLVAIALLHMVFVDLFCFSERTGAVVTIALSAIIFASYHFTPSNPYTLKLAAFYTLAGLYLGIIYTVRGFGVAAGTHAIYDVLTVAIARGLWEAG